MAKYTTCLEPLCNLPSSHLIYHHQLLLFFMNAAAELDLKQRLTHLSLEDRQNISAYLLRLKHASGEGQEEITQLMSEMDSGSKTPLSSLKQDLHSS